jgi:Na+/H+ antiporter NhaD/arsenite permease-like protein
MQAPRRRVATLGILMAGAVVLVALGGAFLPNWRPIAAGIVFAGSYLALAIGLVPGLRIDRAGIALVGAGLMVGSGALSLGDAYKAIDLDTITLLLGMMIVVASLHLSGVFAVAAGFLGRLGHRPKLLLAAVIAISGIASAFLVNDAVCLVLAPLVLQLTLALGRRPLPYLLAVAMASNVGSTATITGNPQNIMIGSLSHIEYGRFAGALAPVALAGLVVTWALIALLHREAFATAQSVPDRVPRPSVADPRLAVMALGATLVMIGLFFAGIVPAEAAIVSGGLLVLAGRMKSDRLYAAIDWPLLMMFAGLFIIVAGATQALVGPATIEAVGKLHLDQVPVLSGVTAILANLVSNVPAVLVLKPFVTSLPDHDLAWLTVAMSATLAGNFTILGSIANLIVVQIAAKSGVAIGFWDYLRVGAPLTLITLAIGTLWLWL